MLNSLPSQYLMPVLVGMLISGLAMLLPLFFACYAFLQRFATKSYVDALEQRSNQRYTENQQRVDKLESRLGVDLIHLEQRLVVQITENRTHTDSRGDELGGKLDTLTSTMQLFTNEMSRVVGSLEGQITGLKEREAARG